MSAPSRLTVRKIRALFSQRDPFGFWVEAFTLTGSATYRVLPRVLCFGLLAAFMTILNAVIPPELGVEVAPYEVAGGLLGVLLVVRTNAGYDRWWEARRSWGAIINNARNLVIGALAYGPAVPAWRENLVRWTIAFAHATGATLRGDRQIPEVAALLGEEHARRIASADHMPTYIGRELARMLHSAADANQLNASAFLAAEQARGRLIDEVGSCERIKRTPLPRVYAILIRRFIFLFLITLPFPLILKVGWLTPFVTMLVAYPILSLDQLGVELQNPFDTQNLSHLPLDQIAARLERNLLELLADDQVGTSEASRLAGPGPTEG